MSLALSLPQLGLSVAAGGLATLSSCVFPLLPLVLGGAVQGHRFAPVAIGLGMMLSFAGIGVVLGALGPALGIDAGTIPVVGTAMLIAFALVMLVASEGGALRGGVVLALFGLGAAIPLVAVAYASRSGFMRARDWILARVERVRRGFAVPLGGLGITILTGADKWVKARVLGWLPDAWVNPTIGI